MAFTYEDFMKRAVESGLLEEFSEYDLSVARKHPEFGLSILTLKDDYKSAKTPEAKALANAMANELRSKYGYTGGSSGSKFYGTGPTFSYSEYESPYTKQATLMLDRLLNRQDFAYDPSTDPSYSAYRKQYLREGKRAAEDVLGSAAALTAGLPSSAAVTAAGQAGDYYAGQLSDKLPALYQQAYDRYLQEYSLDRSKLEAVAGIENRDYSRWADDREFSYQDYIDRLDRASTDRQSEMENERQKTQLRDAAAQKRIQNALKIWQLYGYATQEVADVLGVPVGTPTAALTTLSL